MLYAVLSPIGYSSLHSGWGMTLQRPQTQRYKVIDIDYLRTQRPERNDCYLGSEVKVLWTSKRSADPEQVNAKGRFMETKTD